MALIVFMRGVNVGGKRVFQPSLLAKELAHLDALNVGAAGTFVISGRCAQTTLRAEFLQRLAFPAELMICRGRDLTELVARDPFRRWRPAGDVRRFASVMAKRPRACPPLPLDAPAGESWQVKFIEMSGPFAVGLWRRLGRSLLDPNGVVEQNFGVSATTRNWNTFVRIADILRSANPRALVDDEEVP